MRVFVTGATGFIGSAIVQELTRAGHEVLGLARSEQASGSLITAGARVHRGDLEDLDSLRSGAAMSEGVIHTAFIHDFTKFAANCETDRQAIGALASALAGSGRPLIITSGIGLLPPGRLTTEEDSPSSNAQIPRVASEQAAALAASQGVRVSVVRLPPSVHGEGDHGFVPMLISMAREKGVSAYIGEGLNRWPAVHRLDAARLYRSILEGGGMGSPGSGQGSGGSGAGTAAIYHGVAEEGVPFRDIAAVIGRRLNLPVAGKSPAQAADHFGWFGHFAAMDVPSSSQRTREKLGWQTQQQGLIADLDQPYYFK